MPRKHADVSLDFAAGTRLFDLDRPPHGVYLLRSGQVRLSSSQDAILDHLMPGSFFGEKHLIPVRSDAQTAQALVPVTVSVYGKSQLLDLIQTDRAFALRLLKDLALRIDRYERVIRDFVTRGAEYRLARLLAQLEPVRPASGWVRLRFSPTNSDLARTVGTTRARVAHFMARFQRRGWLRRRPDLWVEREELSLFLGTER